MDPRAEEGGSDRPRMEHMDLIDRRRFLSLGLKASLLVGFLGLPRRKAGAQLQGSGPVVLEAIRRSIPVSSGLDQSEASLLLDELLRPLTSSQDYPLDIWSALFPSDKTAGVKLDAGSPGAISVTLARTLAGRLIDADVPPERVIIWDRRSDALRRAGLAPERGRTPRIRSVMEEAGGGRSIRPMGEAPPATLSALAERIERDATVTALSARTDGKMAPFVIENLALGALVQPPDARGKAKTKGAVQTEGLLAARYAADPALLPRAVLHVADLWRVPLGDADDGTPQLWEAGTILLSQDAVALTAVAHRILANTRRARKLGETPAPESLLEAARLGLGQQDLSKIRWVKLVF